ncbi:MAG: DUF1330 domain-containing protein [Pseudomonadota bacterium]
MPKGYLIGHVNMHNAEAYKPYAERNNELLPKFGGTFLVRGGQGEVVEGDCPSRHVIIEFPSYEQALAFYNSPEYQENMKIRQANSDGCAIIVEGI